MMGATSVRGDDDEIGAVAQKQQRGRAALSGAVALRSEQEDVDAGKARSQATAGQSIGDRMEAGEDLNRAPSHPTSVAVRGRYLLDVERGSDVGDDLRRWVPWIAVAIIAVAVIAVLSINGGG